MSQDHTRLPPTRGEGQGLTAGGLMSQVAAQCRAVAHLARAIADVYDDKAEVFAAGLLANIAEMNGARTAQLMELFGDIANGMDIVEPEDEWVNPVFAEANKRWPSAAGQSLTEASVYGSSPLINEAHPSGGNSHEG